MENAMENSLDKGLNTDLKHLGRRTAARPQPPSRKAAALLGLACFLAGVLTGVSVNPEFGRAPPEVQPPPVQNAGEPEITAEKDPKPMKFEFYTLLPEREVKVPEWSGAREPAPHHQADGASGADGADGVSAPRAGYMLQAGSFRLLEEAERHRRKLAEFGVTAEIQTVVLETGGRWHRIRIGPNADSDALRKLQARLRRHGFHSMLLRLRPKPVEPKPVEKGAADTTSRGSAGQTWSG